MDSSEDRPSIDPTLEKDIRAGETGGVTSPYLQAVTMEQMVSACKSREGVRHCSYSVGAEPALESGLER